MHRLESVNVKVVELNVCERWWSRACDPKPADAGDGGLKRGCVSVFNGTDAKLQWSCMNIIC